MFRREILIGLAALIALLSLGLVTRSVLESVVSPGPLSAAHAKLKANCFACHIPFAKTAQDRTCKSCHKPVAQDIAARTGFHGRNPAARTQTCRTCHTEHKGSAARIAAVDAHRFDHRFTDFMLTGRHRAVQCRDCHRAGEKFSAAPVQCVACHAKRDVHHGSFGKNCAACHGTDDWKRILRFDHSVTGFPLLGLHRTVRCASCHVGGRFKGTPTTCVACHRTDDVHQGARGPDCAGCHTVAGWKLATFDHDRDTRFALIGAHRIAACTTCHRPAMTLRKPPTTCIACHAPDDVHKGANGTHCATCHVATVWKVIRFDHNRLTRFPLRGAHQRVTCAACHKGPFDRVKPPTTCIGCHAAQDVHRGRFGRNCAQCHNEAAWRAGVKFDHSLTRFPLLGRHATLTCASCHADRRFTAKGITCASCHADTFHRGRLGKAPQCGTCHVPSAWRRWTFDHARQTGFVLDGRHATLSCHNCHSQPAARATLQSTCIACHRTDDIHRGQFGARCSDCHTTTAFKPARVPGRIGAGGRAIPGERR